MPIDKQWLVNLSGKLYPTYPGVLDAAWKDGLAEIQVELLQQPTPENGETAVCRATVVIEREGRRLVFSDIGDASPKNVNSRIATALIRMASTRAKGRALRDSINCGDTLLEELPQEEEKPRTVPRPAPPPQDEAELKKVRQRYDDIRAERIALGLPDTGPWKSGWSLEEVKRQATAIFQEVARKRKEQAAPPAPAQAAPASERDKLLGAWADATRLAEEFGLTYTALPKNPTVEIIKSRGLALAESVAEVQDLWDELDAMQVEAEERGLVSEWPDRKKSDPYQLRKLATSLREKLDAAYATEVDPFEEEEA